MGSVTTWARLEPHARVDDIEASLEMRVHDPLWLLARQWQFGELQGEDAGSPVWTQASGAVRPVGLYLPGPVDGHNRDDVQGYSSDVPLEFVVEQERLPAIDVLRANRRLAVDAGQHFLRLLCELAAANRKRLLTDFGVEPPTAEVRQSLDSESAAFLDLVAGRAVDGARLLTTIGEQPAEDAGLALGFAKNDLDVVAKAIAAWRDWCTRMAGLPGPARGRDAWNPQRMEYACAIAAPGGGANAGNQDVLVAREYPGGHLDWYAFDTLPKARLERDLAVQPRPFAVGTLPTNLSFRGMPADRLWEFEDAQVRFGAIEAGPTDLARLLLVEFLVQYGNDFFTIPLEAAAGTLVDLDRLVVTNTFGDVTPATPFAEQEWRLFALSAEDGSQPAGSTLFIPPVLGPHLAGSAIEEVELVRDEMANISWAIERVVPSASGGVLNRHEAYQARRQQDTGTQPPSAGGPVYRLDTWASALPDFWIPLLPEQSAPGQALSRLACYDPQGRSQGLLLSEKDGGTWLYLFDEEVPRSGARVRRVPQYTRWHGGRFFSWIGREKRPGRGSASSGLKYDVVERAPRP
ncbi:MAG: hypothetical protein KA506_15060 [Steroidobacteraceae bacterium]|nr:hypothetical protein [Steroidobacteraceae bacterium]